MNILLFLIPVSLVMIGVAALVFAWAVRHGQFDDLDTPALDILRDDPGSAPVHNAAQTDETPRDAG
ncbi:cbb3-type cytochrome oxidase assembly protein CcoS [Thermomonas sp.]|uniref:cbb3-type cytochrome oxidase assembly protein CcoS n=1 Tax=Thermomonas sp. TaxID=1971895 RepID=UPI002EDC25E7